MAGKNYLFDDKFGCMTSALLRPGVIQALFKRKTLAPDLNTFLCNLPTNDQALADDPEYICVAAGFCVGIPSMDMAGKVASVVAQVCTIGYSHTENSRPIKDVLNSIKQSIQTEQASFPTEVVAGLVTTVPWLGTEETERSQVATVSQISSVFQSLKESGKYKTAIVCILATGLLAVCKQGIATITIINKVSNAIKDELGLNVLLNPVTIRDVWNIAKIWFDPDKAKQFFAFWSRATGTSYPCLNILIPEASWAGMTNYTNISRAKSLFPTFQWAGLAALVPEDFNNYLEAVKKVAGNEYYGYNHDLGIVKSAMYPHLAYAAYKLLIDCGGDNKLIGFQGISRRLPYAYQIDMMVTSYRNLRFGGTGVCRTTIS